MTIYQLDDSRPFLSSGGMPIQWHTGAAAAKILSSSLVRIHPRGLYFKARGWHVRDLSDVGWKSEACFPSTRGICEVYEGSVYFPSNDLPMVDENLVWRCGSQVTSRIVTNESGRYDASACDVLDSEMDYVFSNGMAYSQASALQEWIYWIICILVIYLVRCLSKYVLASLTKENTNEKLPDPSICLLASAACTILVVSQGDHVFVTQEDLIFFWFTVFYIGLYEILFASTRLLAYVRNTEMKDPPFYNLLAGVLQLVASRLYVSAETPYNPPIIFIIAVRMTVKSRRKPDLLRCITLLLDALMLSLTCVFGFGPAGHYLIALLVAAAAWTDFLV